MGRIVVQPNIEVGAIEFDIDKYTVSDDGENRTHYMSNFYPLVQIGDTVFTFDRILKFELNIQLYNLPTILLTIHDPDSNIRNYFQDNINTGIVRLGYKYWGLKFNVLFNESITQINNNDITITGLLWNEKLWDTVQQSFVGMSLEEILGKVSEEAGMGLYVYDNEYLQKTYEHIVRCNAPYISYIPYLMNNYSDNMWVIDANYYLHCASILSLSTDDANVSKYTLDYITGEPLEKECEYIFYKNYNLATEDADGKEQELNNTRRIQIADYTTASTAGTNYINSKMVYYSCNENTMDMIADVGVNQGIGEAYANTFSLFKSHQIPFMNQVKQKNKPSKIITLDLEHIIPELNVFDVVKLELYRRPIVGSASDEDFEQEDEKDWDNSGNRIVIGYKMYYNKMSDEIDLSKSIREKIYCI